MLLRCVAAVVSRPEARGRRPPPSPPPLPRARLLRSPSRSRSRPRASLSRAASRRPGPAPRAPPRAAPAPRRAALAGPWLAGAAPSRAARRSSNRVSRASCLTPQTRPSFCSASSRRHLKRNTRERAKRAQRGRAREPTPTCPPLLPPAAANSVCVCVVSRHPRHVRARLLWRVPAGPAEAAGPRAVVGGGRELHDEAVAHQGHRAAVHHRVAGRLAGLERDERLGCKPPGRGR